MKFRAAPILLGCYVFIATGCFGPALIESQAAERAKVDECRSIHNPKRCFGYDGGIAMLSAMGKAAVWPLWLSYQAALKVRNYG